ncbi:MAG: PSD1 and planctomycete cytochrome C domain-containing protein [Gemmataceae bacterium]
MKHGRFLLLVLIGLCPGLVGFSRAADRAPTADDVRFFESRIRPLLAEHCFTCHGPRRQRAGLRLDSVDGLRKGSSSGAVVIPGQPEKSLLLRVVHHEKGVEKMPPKGKLDARQLADLVRWVKIGAPYPQATTVTKDATGEHWAFVPPAEPMVPPVRDSAWARGAIDRFILAGLEARKLRPTPQADRRTLLRRVTFDLTGLPPTPEEIASFLQDRRADAYERLVDRLLASPAYGERWGRHWLDVARYSDSNGLDENIAHGNAWRYRDWVVTSFNHDQPYDAFLIDQLAGDLVPSTDEATRRARLIATGFLSLGPKVLAEVDERKMELDIVDEQVDTVGKAFLGLTLGCARCHDHKFDPVSQEDYYGLAGIFLSTKTMESFKKVGRWHENTLAGPDDLRRKREHDALVAERKSALAAKKGQPEAELKPLRDELARLEKSAPIFSSAMGVTEAPVTDAPLLRRGNHLRPGKKITRRFPVALASEKQEPLPASTSGRLELGRWLADRSHPLTARVMVNRLWRWHFGQGLVRSVDNFGLLAEKPTHPELLDFLARSFINSGWSIKAMHRQIVLSATYQMASTHDAQAATIDPDNRLWWRMNVRRLEAEAIRDNLLSVSKGLDRSMGGSLLHVANRGYLFDHTSRDQTAYDSPRRSLYLPVIRNNLYDVFGLFDSTDATVGSGDRATTTVATQALFWMNSDLARQSAERLATLLLARGDLDDTARTELLYQIAYGRPPTPGEIHRVQVAVAGFEEALQAREADVGRRRLEAWAWLCHAVIAANEFVYVN